MAEHRAFKLGASGPVCYRYQEPRPFFFRERGAKPTTIAGKDDRSVPLILRELEGRRPRFEHSDMTSAKNGGNPPFLEYVTVQ